MQVSIDVLAVRILNTSNYISISNWEILPLTLSALNEIVLICYDRPNSRKGVWISYMYYKIVSLIHILYNFDNDEFHLVVQNARAWLNFAYEDEATKITDFTRNKSTEIPLYSLSKIECVSYFHIILRAYFNMLYDMAHGELSDDM